MAAGPWGTDIDQDFPSGEHDSLTCRHCGAHRHLEGRTTEPGARVLICWVCDVPDTALTPPMVQ